MKITFEKQLKQRRFYMMLPLLTLPFVTLAFWALGGGKGVSMDNSAAQVGMNVNLPGAHFTREKDLWDKVALYEEAARDSIEYEEARRNDPYYVVDPLTVEQADSSEVPALNATLENNSAPFDMEGSARAMEEKLAALTEQLEQNQTTPLASSHVPDERSSIAMSTMEDVYEDPAVIDVEDTGTEMDPEMEKIDNVLEKILDIQHPERVNQRLSAASDNNKQMQFVLRPAREDEPISVIESHAGDTASMVETDERPVAFFGLEDDMEKKTEDGLNAFEAVCDGTQTVFAGSTIRLRLVSGSMIGGRLLPRGQLVYGTCEINGERLIVKISSLRSDHFLIPVAMKAFDLDGIEGIHIPGNLANDAAKQTTNQSLQSVQLIPLEGGLEAQAANIGMQASKGLFTKKSRVVNVTVKAGYRMLLRNEQQAFVR